MLRKCHAEPAVAAKHLGRGSPHVPRSLAPLGMTGWQLFSWSVVPVASGMNDSGTGRNPCGHQTYERRNEARVSGFRAAPERRCWYSGLFPPIRCGMSHVFKVGGRECEDWSWEEASSQSSASWGQAVSRMFAVRVDRSKRPFGIDSTNFPAKKFSGHRRFRPGSPQQDNGRRTGSVRAHR